MNNEYNFDFVGNTSFAAEGSSESSGTREMSAVEKGCLIAATAATVAVAGALVYGSVKTFKYLWCLNVNQMKLIPAWWRGLIFFFWLKYLPSICRWIVYLQLGYSSWTILINYDCWIWYVISFCIWDIHKRCLVCGIVFENVHRLWFDFNCRRWLRIDELILC